MKSRAQRRRLILSRTFLACLELALLASCTSIPPDQESGDVAKPSTTSQSQSNTRDNQFYSCYKAASYAGKVVGDGHCVSLIKHCSGAPDTIYWRQGKPVLEQPPGSIAPGTIIATFENGRYPSRHGYHAAIYIRHDDKGIWVWDQWRGKAVHQRLIRNRDHNSIPSNRAQNYRLVKRVD